jgi:hypothetical protein
MTSADARGEWFQQAKFLAREILNVYTEADEAQVYPLSQVRLNAPFLTRGQALEALDRLQLQDNNQPYTALLSGLGPLFAEAGNSNRQLFVVSDFQRSTVLADTLQGLTLAPGVGVTFLPVGSRVPQNVYISNLQWLNTLPEVGKPVELQLTVNNASSDELRNISVRATVEGQEVGIGTVESIAPNGSAQTKVVFTPQRAGWLAGQVIVEDPAVEFDNVRHFTLYIPQNLQVLLVEGQEPVQYLKLLYENLLGQYKLRSITERELPNQQLGQYAVVVLCGPQNVSGGMAERLAQYVREGGGLMVFPTTQWDTRSLNDLYQKLGVGQWGSLLTLAQPTALARPDLQQPLFQGVFEGSNTNAPNAQFDSPRIQQLMAFTPASGGVQRTLLTDKLGRAVLHEAQVGEGRVLTFALAPTLPWGDFPLKSSFVPILHRSTLLLSHQPSAQDWNQTIGRYSLYRLRTADEGQATLRNSEGLTFIPEQYSREGALLLKFDYLNLQPGVYGVYQADSLRARIAFNLSDAESQLSVIEAEELESVLADAGLTGIRCMAGRPEVARAAVQEAAGGTPLWKWFVLVCALALLAEIAVAKLWRERPAPIVAGSAS